jgi:Tfp pilus assembly protein PilN
VGHTDGLLLAMQRHHVQFRLGSMAKSHQTFQKREREKKRLERRQNKQEKVQHKHKRDGNSLDDMIAYVDENGEIVDTRPIG